MERLSKATKEITCNLGSVTLDELLALIAKHAAEILGAEVSGVHLVKREGFLSLEASYGHREGSFQKGREFTIRSDPQSGLTGHIAYEGKLFNAHGDALKNHFAVQDTELNHLPSGECYSLLAIPLKKKVGEEEKLVGLLRAENKKQDGHPLPTVSFTKEDEWILNIFAENIVVALDSANLVKQLNEQNDHLELILKASHTLARAENLTEGLQSLAEMVIARLTHTFCRTLLLDESGKFLVVTAAYPVPRSGEKLDWNLGLGKHISISEWLGLDMLLDTGSPTVLSWSDEHDRPVLERFSRALGSEQDIHSLLMMPLKMRNRVVGLLEVGEARGEERIHFTDAEIDLTAAIAAETAALIDRMRFYEIIERNKIELENLHMAAQAMSGAFDLKHVLQTITEQVKDVLQADSSAIWSYDNIRDKFIPEELVATSIPDQELERFKEEEPKPGGIAYTIMEKGWIGVTDISSPEFEFLRQPSRELMERIELKSFQGNVLKVGDEPLGVLYANYKQSRDFGDEDRRTLENLANYAALALKKARLLDQVNKAKKAAEVVAQITALGNSEATLVSITKGTQEAVGCDAVTLYVYDQTSGRCDHPSAMVGVRYPGIASQYEASSVSIVYKMLERDEPYFVDKVAEDAHFKHTRFARDEGIESCAAVPLKAAGQKVGVMFVNYRSRHRFTTDELTKIELFANQAAVAIRNTQLHERTKRQAETLGGLYEADKAITSTLTLDEVLTRIAEQALHIVGANPQEGCFSHVALLEENKLRFIAGFPLEILTDLHHIIGEIDLQKDAKKGIDGRAVITGQSQNVAEVGGGSDPNWIALREGSNIHSQLSVPLKIGERIIGVLSSEHPKPAAFGDEDMVNVELLAAQAAVAIENARQYGNVETMLAARTALAWTGMVSSTWRHAIEKHAVTIREQIEHLRNDLAKLPKSDSIDKRLEMIERLANQILGKPVTAPLSAEEGAVSVPINKLIRERTNQLWKHDFYMAVKLDLDLILEESATVRTGPEWLRRALDILIDNAVEATAGLPARQLKITTRRLQNEAEISISDNGKGIPPKIQERLFREPIKKPKGAKGLGMGLLFAQIIIQTYGGDIRRGSSGSAGTTMVVSLPLEV